MAVLAFTSKAIRRAICRTQVPRRLVDLNARRPVPIFLFGHESQRDCSLEEAADRLGITSSERSSAVEKLEEIETGSKFPTRNQLIGSSQV